MSAPSLPPPAVLVQLQIRPRPTSPGFWSPWTWMGILTLARANDNWLSSLSPDDRFLCLVCYTLEGKSRFETAQLLKIRCESECIFSWTPVTDIYNPFAAATAGTPSVFSSAWFFDVESDIVFHTDAHRRVKLPLAILRKRPVRLEDFQLDGPAVGASLRETLAADANRRVFHWAPKFSVDQRRRSLLQNLLLQFDRDWRHILRGQYNGLTRAQFAKAIIRIVTLEITVKRQISYTGRVQDRSTTKSMTSIFPRWDHFMEHVTQLPGVHLVVCSTVQAGLEMARRHYAKHGGKSGWCCIKCHNRYQVNSGAGAKHSDTLQPNYILLSVRYVSVCRITGPKQSPKMECTLPERFLSGNLAAMRPAGSSRAIDYLVWATSIVDTKASLPGLGLKSMAGLGLKSLPGQGLKSYPDLGLKLLPTEMQDMILHYVAFGPLHASILGCRLGIGTPHGEGKYKLHYSSDDQSEALALPRIEPRACHIWFGDVPIGRFE